MRTTQIIWSAESGWMPQKEVVNATWVLAFGSREALSNHSRYEELRAMFPHAQIMLATTSGEIIGSKVMDDNIIATAVEFHSTQLHPAQLNIRDVASSFDAGQALCSALAIQGLKHVFVISDGSLVNGSELVRGMNKQLPEGVAITGALAGDADRFEKTLVGLNAAPDTGNIVAVGFYGDDIRIGFASVGGWNTFGPERYITKSKDNVLYELDGKSALDLYKRYLGDKASGLPGTALFFPLSIRETADAAPVVRTILAVDEEEQSMTFAGNVPEGSIAKLMMTNLDRLVEGASAAAEQAIAFNNIYNDAELVICISCVGRKLLLGPRVEEEVEEVRHIVGERSIITGFYSYGEIAPSAPATKCELHNQTMTITALREELPQM